MHLTSRKRQARGKNGAQNSCHPHLLNMKSIQLLVLCSSQNKTIPFSVLPQSFKCLKILPLSCYISKLVLVTWLMCGPFSERDNGLHQKVETFLHISVGFIMLKRADVRSVWWGQHSGKAYVGS